MDDFDAFDPFAPDDLDELEATESASSASVSRRKLIILWLLALGMLLVLIPLFMLSKTLQDEAEAAALEIEAYELEPPATPTPPLEIQPLLATLEASRQRVVELHDASTVLRGELGLDVYWPNVIAAVKAGDPDEIRISTFSQAGRQITLEGIAANDSVLAEYVRLLEASGVFGRVLVQSITLIDTDYVPVVPSVTPTASVVALPPADQIAHTPPLTEEIGPLDAWEIDDFEPSDIVMGEARHHTFYPVYDVDTARFLAKEGRHYRVSTLNLDPGVDTHLSVEVGGRTYINDDVQPGELRSEIVFAMDAPDAYAIVRITNRGLYGPDLGYGLEVVEVIPTPTPTATPEPVPTSTPVPQPASSVLLPPAQSAPQPTVSPPVPEPTRTPVPTATATPDARDAYEPDEVLPASITVSEMQLRNFHPDLDTDHLVFLAKSGRRYRVSTFALAMGVDTVLTVVVGDAVYTNDDCAWDDLSSEVSFTQSLPYDTIAEIHISNRGRYGPDAFYRVLLQVLPPEPTATPSPTTTFTAVPTATPTSTVTPTPTVLAGARAWSAGPVDPRSAASLIPRRLPGLAKSRRYVSMRLPASQDSDAWGPEAVAFVIVLELRETPP
jgi:Tfp pilus assembly protein PilN